MSPTVKRVVRTGSVGAPDPNSGAKHRANQTLRNLIYALLASVGILLVMVLVLPRDDSPIERNVDYAATASQAQADSPMPLASPELPDTWVSNEVRWSPDPSDGVPTWYAGFIIDNSSFAGFTQAYQANDTWLYQQLDEALATGTRDIAGVQFTVYDRTGDEDVSRLRRYQMSGQVGDSTVIIYGTAADDDLVTLATATIESITAKQEEGTS